MEEGQEAGLGGPIGIYSHGGRSFMVVGNPEDGGWEFLLYTPDGKRLEKTFNIVTAPGYDWRTDARTGATFEHPWQKPWSKCWGLIRCSIDAGDFDEVDSLDLDGAQDDPAPDEDDLNDGLDDMVGDDLIDDLDDDEDRDDLDDDEEEDELDEDGEDDE